MARTLDGPRLYGSSAQRSSDAPRFPPVLVTRGQDKVVPAELDVLAPSTGRQWSLVALRRARTARTLLVGP